jgi:inorganic pyrophosphatase
VRTLADLGDHWQREIETFFATYKLLEPKQTEVLGWHTADEAFDVIAACRRRYESTKEHSA